MFRVVRLNAHKAAVQNYVAQGVGHVVVVGGVLDALVYQDDRIFLFSRFFPPVFQDVALKGDVCRDENHAVPVDDYRVSPGENQQRIFGYFDCYEEPDQCVVVRVCVVVDCDYRRLEDER